MEEQLPWEDRQSPGVRAPVEALIAEIDVDVRKDLKISDRSTFQSALFDHCTYS